MSHPDPTFDPEGPVHTEDDEHSPVRRHRAPEEKSLSRHRKKVAKAMRGMYPGSVGDNYEKLKHQAANLVKRHFKK